MKNKENIDWELCVLIIISWPLTKLNNTDQYENSIEVIRMPLLAVLDKIMCNEMASRWTFFTNDVYMAQIFTLWYHHLDQSEAKDSHRYPAKNRNTGRREEPAPPFSTIRLRDLSRNQKKKLFVVSEHLPSVRFMDLSSNATCNCKT